MMFYKNWLRYLYTFGLLRGNAGLIAQDMVAFDRS